MMRSTRQPEKSSSSRIISETKAIPRSGKIALNINEDYQPSEASGPPQGSSAPALLEVSKLSESTFHMVNTTRPSKNQSIQTFDLANKIKNTASASFHKVYKVHKINKDHGACYFFKKNKTHSLMSVLEATACHFYQYLIPGDVPTAHAHYDGSSSEKPYVGISSKGLPGFRSTMEDPLTIEDLKDKNLVKGLARCLAASYLFEEDDLHRGNMRKNGQRIDFDMSLWPILCKFKEIGYIDWTFRSPTAETFAFHEEDIRHFPNVKMAKPFYWPTNPAPIIPQSIRTALSPIVAISKNAFSDSEIKVYQLLENDETFQYECNRIFLKFILTNYELFRDIAYLHIPVEAENVTKVISKHEMHRIKRFTEVWTKMPESKEFMLHNGKKALAEILQEQIEWNKKIERKIMKHPEEEEKLRKLLVNIDEIKTNFGVLISDLLRPAKKA